MDGSGELKLYLYSVKESYSCSQVAPFVVSASRQEADKLVSKNFTRRGEGISLDDYEVTEVGIASGVVMAAVDYYGPSFEVVKHSAGEVVTENP